ncbi:hypothetical protein LIER_42927 [Lithospermum erythrorhizon]|uniref:Uncharacterized protein n=1 Tax=Lithospermum erythrorhizon TaxID=34254 RepID=A0AAV3P9T8_LITER
MFFNLNRPIISVAGEHWPSSYDASMPLSTCWKVDFTCAAEMVQYSKAPVSELSGSFNSYCLLSISGNSQVVSSSYPSELSSGDLLTHPHANQDYMFLQVSDLDIQLLIGLGVKEARCIVTATFIRLVEFT